jgi:hypothetical protein
MPDRLPPVLGRHGALSFEISQRRRREQFINLLLARHLRDPGYK